MDQLHAVSPDTSNNATNADSEGLIDVSLKVRDPTTFNDSVSASAPSVPKPIYPLRTNILYENVDHLEYLHLLTDFLKREEV